MLFRLRFYLPEMFPVVFVVDKSKLKDRLIWVDCEMTGLEVETDVLLEIAVVVTEVTTSCLRVFQCYDMFFARKCCSL